MDLSLSSALAILIDTSSSMSDEIEAVKNEVADIIETAAEGGIIPSLYILAAYEAEVNYIETESASYFLEEVNKLRASGTVENFWHAAQMTLEGAPPFSDLIAFTDETSDDEEELKSVVIALAEKKHSKVTIIWTGGPVMKLA